MSGPHDELLDAAIQAHKNYEQVTAQLKLERQQAFKRALTGPVSGRELASRTGLSESHVGRIARGQR